MDSDKNPNPNTIEKNQDLNKPKEGSTQEMIQDINQKIANIDLEKVPYIFNNRKVAILESKLQTAQGNEKLNLLLTYGLELLNAGRSDESIGVLNQVLQVVGNTNVRSKPELIYFIKKQLAIAYMRKAEQDNCIANHNEESCIIPVSKKAQHIIKDGAQQSIVILKELLSINPNDLECQYLLNIANMTLGQYAENVPEEYRIPESYFSNSAKFPQFTDIAMSLGVDVNLKSGGTCIDDFNGDGYLDIIASSWGLENQIRYFENDRMGGFSDKTNDAGLEGVAGGLNLRHADFNNDGHLDFIILRGAWLSVYGSIPNSLMRNNGDGTFKNIAKDAGITITGFFKGVASGDINNDLYPDLYLSNYDGLNTLYINTTEETGAPSFKIADKSAGVSNSKLSFPT